MNLENRSCKLSAALIETPCLAGWRRGYAADCKSVIAFRVSDNEINAIDPVSVSDNTPGHSGNAPETLTTGIGHPYDNLPCHLTDNPRPTAAAIVALCLFAGVAGAFGLALWVVL